MRKSLAVLLAGALFAVSCAGLLSGCTPKEEPGTEPDGPTEPVDKSFEITGDEIQTDRASLDFAFDGIYTDGELKSEGFSSASDITGGRFFVNGNYYDGISSVGSRQDVKLELFNGNAARLVNLSSGFAFTLPVTELTVDYSIAKYRTQYHFDDSILTASLDTGNPYTAQTDAWYVYVSEWLFKYFDEELFDTLGIEMLSEPDYTFTKQNPYGNLEVKKGYDVYRYDLLIKDNEEIERSYYNIAAVRQTSSNKDHVLFVMKSKEDKSALMDDIVQSYTRLTTKGLARNYYDAGEPVANPKWNAETKAFYEDFISAESVRWGVFSMSMPGYRDEWKTTDPNYTYVFDLSSRFQQGLEEAFGRKYDIYPTYTALAYAGEPVRFPVYMAQALAGGNGFEEKPVLQFTYQFTGNNNLMGATPMFDIMRGKYDAQFRELARDIKNYGAPVLFRLNNEMNSDWTSYCGLITLLDPDIFSITWRRLYSIFEEEKVDNAIWIWNPIAESCPYSGWGEDLCSFPGKEYVQLLGGTYYELNNYSASSAAASCKSFRNMYTSLYEKNKTAFSRWAMILSEFGCGSGGDYSGELGRNRGVQLQWVKDMFAEFNAAEKADYIKQIKGAIWFNGNDYYDGKIITNRYQIYDPRNNNYSDLLPLLQAFKEGFAKGG